MKKIIRGFAGLLFFLAASCAVITVNIYFPEKDVKEAYKALEKELMTPDQKPDQKLDPAKSGAKSESFLQFEFVRSVNAQEAGLADKISDAVKKMPDVVNAYREMGSRIAEIDRLRDSGAVGEGNNGLLVEREKNLSQADRKIIDADNSNRKTVMAGMAKAIIRINRQPETSENLKQVTPQATKQFASIRNDSAKKGWWIQDENGNWSRK